MARLLVMGDLHGDSSSAKRLARRAVNENVNLVVLCGDIVNSRVESSGLLKPFADAGKKLVLIPGNHDVFGAADFLAEIYGAKNIHGYSIAYNDIGLFGCSGVNVGPNALPEREIFETLKKGFERIKGLSKRVMVTHVFPSDSLMERLSHKSLPGSSGVRRAVEELKPDVLFCSHAHESEGVEEKIGRTRVISVGREGKVINL